MPFGLSRTEISTSFEELDVRVLKWELVEVAQSPGVPVRATKPAAQYGERKLAVLRAICHRENLQSFG